MKLETSRNVTKSKRSLHWCRSISKKYLCTFYYSISQKVITLSGRRFITVSGVLLHYRAVITLSGVFLLHYRAVITVSGVYYIIGWYSASCVCSVSSTSAPIASVNAPSNQLHHLYYDNAAYAGLDISTACHPPSLLEESMTSTQTSMGGRDLEAAPKLHGLIQSSTISNSAGLDTTNAAQMVFDRP